MNRRSGLAGVVLAMILSAAFAMVALAHTVNWSIPFVDGNSYWGFGCHTDKQFPFLPDDYHFCGGASVSQSSLGSFDWWANRVTQGVEYNPPAWYGDILIWDQPSGQILRTSSAFFCQRVNQGGTDLSVFFSQHNPSAAGTYQQRSGAGDASCLTSYVVDDYLGVLGQ